MNKKRVLALLAVVMILVSMLPLAFATGDQTPPADGATPPAATDSADPSTSTDAETDEQLPWYANSGIIQFLPILIIIVVFYFFLIRPESKRKKETAQMRDNLAVGDRIATIGGILGRIIKIKDDEILIETSTDKSKILLKKWAVSSVEKKGKGEPESEKEESDKE